MVLPWQIRAMQMSRRGLDRALSLDDNVFAISSSLKFYPIIKILISAYSIVLHFGVSQNALCLPLRILLYTAVKVFSQILQKGLFNNNNHNNCNNNNNNNKQWRFSAKFTRTTVFCKIFGKFSITWGRLQISRWPFMCNSRSLSIRFPTIFWSPISYISPPGLGFFFHRKKET